MNECVCEHCGIEFSGRKGQRYCSIKCANRASKNRCGGSENSRLRHEIEVERAWRRQERLEMQKRLAERDAAFAAAYPLLASGANRGTRFCGTFGKRETPMPIDVATHKEAIVFSEASTNTVLRKQKTRTKDKGQKTKKGKMK